MNLNRISVGWIVCASLALVAVVVVGWRMMPRSSDGAPFDNGFTSNISYPYTASPERERQIRDNYTRIRPGSSLSEVTFDMGTPDETRSLFDPFVLGRMERVGTTYWYFIEKKDPRNNLSARVVRVSFDLSGRVRAVDGWGLEKTSPKLIP